MTLVWSRPVSEEEARASGALGRELIAAIVRADFARVREVLHPELQLRGLTPGSFREAKGEGAIDQAIAIFKKWFFEDEDFLTSVERCEVRPLGRHGRYKLSFRVRGKSPGMVDTYSARKLRELPDDADWIVEQEAYYEVRDGKISWLTMLCGGYHPADEVGPA